MGMEPKDYAEEGIGHPNQHLRIWLDSYRVFFGGYCSGVAPSQDASDHQDDMKLF